MSEWHVTPDYIVTHWTDELFDLMIEKLKERRDRETNKIREVTSRKTLVSDSALFARAKNMIKVVKKN